MKERLLNFLRCPDCKTQLEVTVFDMSDDEITTGILDCGNTHFFPIINGIPRMLSNSLSDYWPEINAAAQHPVPARLEGLFASQNVSDGVRDYDTRTKANFSNEWDNHDVGGKTWGMELNDRVKWFFLDSIRIPKEDLKGLVMLDAGCGNGSQSVAYTEFGLEVIAVDLSTGLEKGYEYRGLHPKADADKVHFVQGDLAKPPLADDSFDIIHSAGVLHHTPNTERTFRSLRPLLKKGGTYYVWLYKYENIVTPIVNTLRAVTTRIPAGIFAGIANLAAVPFIGFCWTVDKLGIRHYDRLDSHEAAIAVHDIFGAPYAHYHDFSEVSKWYDSVGLHEYWPCNESRRGFGICGR